MFFEWNDGIWGAKCRDCIVLLLLEKDNYSVLDAKISDYACFILQNEFSELDQIFHPILTDSKIEMAEMNETIRKLVDLRIIRKTENENRRNEIAIQREFGGISQKEWISRNDRNEKVSKWLVIRAFISLCKVQYILKRKKLKGIVDILEKASRRTAKTASIELSNKLAAALDKACLFFPKRTACLAYAAALFIMHSKLSLGCKFAIGVQNLPFYAHAWAEADNTIINDQQELNKKLAPILTISNL